MSTQDGRFHIVYNGEIYNYVELRTELERQGARFRGGSDTEVLLELLAREGTSALGRLEGMFAFALYDHVARSVLLARDFFGIKPLFYTTSLDPGGGRRVAFASEIEPLLELGWGDRKPNAQAVFDYLRFGLTDHGESTCFADIHQLRPGHLVELDLRALEHVRQQEFWRLRLRDVGDITFDEAKMEARRLFLRSVERHLRSDVALGAALSGGIDSSSIVAGIRAVSPDAEIHAFSFVPSQPELSEERWARAAAAAAGAELHFTRPDSGRLRRDLDRLVEVQGEPFGTTSIFAQYRVFALAKEVGMKVVLDGQGADEILGGYDYFAGARLAGLLSRFRFIAALRFAREAGKLPGRDALMAEAGQFILPHRLGELSRHLVGRESVPGWLDRDWFEDRGAVLQAPERPSGKGVFKAELLRSLAEGLPKLLRYEDRSSMAHSIESRVPFLVPQLVEFLVSLPDEYLLSPRGYTKHVLREAMRGLVPDAVLDRPDKVGFVTPERDWLVGLGDWVDSKLRRPAPVRGDVLVESWRRVAKREGAHGPRFWRTINLSLWAERFQVSFTD